jgi:hypothetical protein
MDGMENRIATNTADITTTGKEVSKCKGGQRSTEAGPQDGRITRKGGKQSV